MGSSFFRFAYWISFPLYCLTSLRESSAWRQPAYCVECTVKGITTQQMFMKCDENGMPQNKVADSIPERRKSSEKYTTDVFENAINFDVKQAFQAFNACDKYDFSKVQCTMRPKNNEEYVGAFISIKTTLSQSELQSLLEMTNTPSFCQHLPCYGFINLNITRGLRCQSF